MGKVAVCGAGAAGLGAAASLRRAGLDPLVLERSDRVGASWRSRYPALRLNTPGLLFTGYRTELSGLMRFDARSIARALTS